MEQFLRTYYTNLNPNATEEEILAFLQSQGFGSTTTAEGITAINPMPIQTGGDGDGGGGITRINLPVGARSPTRVETGIGFAIHPFIGMAMQAQRLADQGKLPFGLNKVLGSRASGNVELDLEPQMSDIFTAQSLSDSFSGEEGPTGGGGGNIEGSVSPGGTDDTPGTPF
tara:strand:- start:48 stop:557 length:510 start_codon:yes stop_codon:yes gene_type:complete